MVPPAPVACKLKCVLSLVRKQKLFHFVYLNMKGFVLSFHQRFYKPHSNSESAQKHLNFVNWTHCFLQNDSGSWFESFAENRWQFSMGDASLTFIMSFTFWRWKCFGLNFIPKPRSCNKIKQKYIKYTELWIKHMVMWNNITPIKW